MPAAAPLERLQPCLFDRLIDDDPNQRAESRVQRIISMTRYREGVLRDLVWLLNASAHAPEEGLDEFPEVERSVMNFGKRGLSGMVASSLDSRELEEEITRVVTCFEPRVIADTLKVRAVADEKGVNPNVVAFVIEGELWAQPFPEKLYLKTALDMESGTIAL